MTFQTFSTKLASSDVTKIDITRKFPNLSGSYFHRSCEIDVKRSTQKAAFRNLEILATFELQLNRCAQTRNFGFLDHESATIFVFLPFPISLAPGAIFVYRFAWGGGELICRYCRPCRVRCLGLSPATPPLDPMDRVEYLETALYGWFVCNPAFSRC